MAKKKILSIKLINGRLIQRDITLQLITSQFGAPANDIAYAHACQEICMKGHTDPDTVDETNYTHIAPSQIESVSLTIIEEKENEATRNQSSEA